MPENVLAIDSGTTNVLAMIVNADGRVIGKTGERYQLQYPGPGLVEEDPEELWSITKGAVTRVLREAGLSASDLSGVGITGQRTSIIIWERETGRSLGPAIIWQDQRGAQRAAELATQGFPVSQITSASKLEGALANIPDGRARMGRGELAWGNVDSFLAWRLSSGAAHVTDISQACTTGYYDFFTQQLNSKLLEHQDLDPSMFPTFVDSSGIIGTTSVEGLGAEVPIGAIIGDQQSAVYGQGCHKPGEGKVTFGTSGTGNINTGPDIKLAAGTYPLILWRRGGELTYCMEGMVITAGAIFDWLAHGLGILPDVSSAAEVASSVSDTQGVAFLPALQGLGSPRNQPDRHGLISGLTRGATSAHIVRAAMEGVAFRIR
ncbi:MAG: glycerol kinase, partial [Deltaproteobacteria bacterium]|nr:glycerol kinase [Deltaproteobacteria bacterium]